MAQRITERMLDATCDRINGAFGQPGHNATPWMRVGEKLAQRPGFYYVDGAYGGVALYRTCDPDANGESHGVDDVFRSGHVPKRELYGLMHAYLDGIDAARRAA